MAQTEEQRKRAFEAAGVPLPKTTAPTTVTGDSGITDPQIPEVQPTPADVTTATSQTAGAKTRTQELLQERERAIADEQARIEREQTQRATEQTGLLSQFFTDRESRADLTNEFEQKFGADSAEFLKERKAKEAEYDAVYNEFLSAKEEVEQAQANLEGQGRGIPIDLLDNQRARIAKNATPRLNALAAQANMVAAQIQRLEGNFADAQNLVQKAVSNAVADQKDDLDRFLAFREIESDSFDAIDKTYRDAYDQRVEVLKEEYNQAVKEKTYAANSQLEFPNAGILITDTIEEVNAKIAKVGGRTSGQIVGSADTGYKNVITDAQGNIVRQDVVSGPSTTAPDIEQDVREDAVALLGDGLASEDVFNRLRILYKPSEISDQEIQSILGIQPAVEEVEEAQSVIEQDIANISRGGVLTKGDVRDTLRRRGYSQAEINNSSVGTFIDKTVSGLYNFLFSN